MYTLALLIHNGIQGNGGLAGLAVADDQLTLAPSDGHQSVDSLNTRLQGYGDALTVQHTGCRAFHGPEAVVLNGALAVHRAAQGVHYAAAHSLAHGHLNDVARPAHGVALLNGGEVAQQHHAHIVLVQVHHHAPEASLKLQHFPGHHIGQARHMADAVGHADNLAGLININGIVRAAELFANALQHRQLLLVIHAAVEFHLLAQSVQLMRQGSVVHGVAHLHTHAAHQAVVHLIAHGEEGLAEDLRHLLHLLVGEGLGTGDRNI